MKKFVSLVLVLALALSLCTVAMAAKTYDNLYYWDYVNSKWAKQDLTGAAISYTEPTETKQDGELVSGSVGYYTVTLADEAADTFVVVDKADADVRLDVNGKTVYLTESNVFSYTEVGTWVKSSDKCGEAKFNKANFDAEKIIKFVDEDDDVYYCYPTTTTAVTNVNVLADGVVEVCALLTENTSWVSSTGVAGIGEGKYVVNAHDWDVVGTLDTAAETVTGTAVCSVCGQKGTVTDDPTTIPSNATVEDLTYGLANLYVYFVAAGTAAGTTSTTVDSSKTFDAGVAMYVGLSLMSVAGSAVVIGKKKEF